MITAAKRETEFAPPPLCVSNPESFDAIGSVFSLAALAAKPHPALGNSSIGNTVGSAIQQTANYFWQLIAGSPGPQARELEPQVTSKICFDHDGGQVCQ
jgi:hypothetical protein